MTVKIRDWGTNKEREMRIEIPGGAISRQTESDPNPRPSKEERITRKV